MENYAVYRIAETVRVLIFLTLCIVLLDFYPVTALMIVMLAILNDLPIMMIAFDNAPVAQKPVRWQMNRIMTLATILGILGVVSRLHPALGRTGNLPSPARRNTDPYLPQACCRWSLDDLPCPHRPAAFLGAPVSLGCSFWNSRDHPVQPRPSSRSTVSS